MTVLQAKSDFGAHTAWCHGEKTSIRCLLFFYLVMNPRPDHAKREKNVDFGKWSKIKTNKKKKHTEPEVSGAKSCRHMTQKTSTCP